MGVLIGREELYELVWSKPITKIAKDYAVSDSAIVKMCKKMEIPRPGLGYWTKVECGKKVKVTPLPKLSKKGADYHYLRRQGYSKGRADKSGQVLPEIAQEATEQKRIIVADILENPHQITAQNIKRFGNAKRDEKGFLKPRAAKHFDLMVTEVGLDRALRIMDALLRAFEERGWHFDIFTEPKLSMGAVVDGETIRFSLEEAVQGVEHVLTEKEKRARSGGDWVWPPRYDFIPTGKLKLKIDTFYSYSGRSTWADGNIQRVEGCLNKFCAGLVQYSQTTVAWILATRLAWYWIGFQLEHMRPLMLFTWLIDSPLPEIR